VKIFHNFYNSGIRDSELNLLALKNNIQNVSIFSTDKNTLPHYRFFEFKSDDVSIIIRPDGGIEHGWNCAEYVQLERHDRINDFNILKKTEFPILYSVLINKNME
jgi:hypothetical protein